MSRSVQTLGRGACQPYLTLDVVDLKLLLYDVTLVSIIFPRQCSINVKEAKVDIEIARLTFQQEWVGERDKGRGECDKGVSTIGPLILPLCLRQSDFVSALKMNSMERLRGRQLESTSQFQIYSQDNVQ